MKKKYTLEEAIQIYEDRISNGRYIDSVHKIKMMTTIEMLKKLMFEDY
tara:strand:+ start:121 stop:264 length:144 start_codon:yes stop_codon:yes gene_type:complete